VLGGLEANLGILALTLVAQVSCAPVPAVAHLEAELQVLLASGPPRRPRRYFERLHAIQHQFTGLQGSGDRLVVRQAFMGEATILMHLAQLQPGAPLPRRLTPNQRVIYLQELHRIAASNVQTALVLLNRAIELSRVYRLEDPCSEVAGSIARKARSQLDSLTQQMAELGD